MKKFLLLLAACFFAATINAQTYVGGAISSNTTWTTAGSPYIVQADIAVMAGATLTVQPGVTVKFDTAKSMQFFGTFRAIGTQSQPITFTANSSHPAAGDWGYLLFDSISPSYNFANDSGSVMEYCIVQYAGSAVVIHNGIVRVSGTAPYINHCTIQNNSKTAVKAWNMLSTLHIDSSSIQHNNVDTGAVYVCRGGIVINNSNISYNNTSIDTTYSYLNTSVAGVYTYNANSTIKNCVLKYNNSRAIYNYIHNISFLKDTIISDTISHNNKDGIYNYSYSSTTIKHSVFFINNNTITYNYGSGINSNLEIIDSAYYNVSNNSILNNTCHGIYTKVDGNEYSTYDIYYNIINNNSRSGIALNDYDVNGFYNINNNIIKNNLVNGIYIYDDDIRVTSFNILNNTIKNNSGNGIAEFKF